VSTSGARQGRLTQPAATGWLGAGLFVAAVYVAVVFGGGQLLGRAGSPHLGLSILATAVVATTVEPVRAGVERAAARVLRRGQDAPYDVLTRFFARVSGTASAEPEGGKDVPARMAQVLAEGTAAAWAQVWLLVNGRPTLVAAYPEGAGEGVAAPSLRAQEPTAGLRTVTVTSAGRQLGMLRVQERPNRPLTPVEERLFTGLAAQAGLVLHTAALRAELTARRRELSARAVELKHARSRLIAAQDSERRRLERDIHDGAQQQLVALGINLRLAETLGGIAPQRAAELLAGQRVAVDEAIETLATLSRGDQPKVLRQGGLREALRAAAAASPVPATVVSPDIGRFSPAVEACLYFCGVEALQNVAKHADARHVEVRLTVAGSELRLTVADDGRGIAADAPAGSGLANLRERLAAVAGQLSVRSAAGRGTAVTAVVPALRLPAQRKG
jgi:signal transduction histidine kinase